MIRALYRAHAKSAGLALGACVCALLSTQSGCDGASAGPGDGSLASRDGGVATDGSRLADADPGSDAGTDDAGADAGDAGASLTADIYLDRFLAKSCAWFLRCEPKIGAVAFGEVLCHPSRQRELRASFVGLSESGAVVFDAEVGARCLAQLDAAGCNVAELDLDLCDRAFVGQSGPGEACATGLACAEGECVVGATCPGSAACIGGTCFCPGTKTNCGGVCRELTTSRNNCGACGVACARGATCESGRCVCPIGEEACGGSCVDIGTNTDHCGGCDIVCGGGQTCEAGRCLCPAGSSACGDGCYDLLNDAGHCGDCASSCSMVCRSAACTTVVKLHTNVSGRRVSATLADGSLTFWGRVDGSSTQRIPIGVPGLSHMVAYASSVVTTPWSGSPIPRTSCAIRDDGTVICWLVTRSPAPTTLSIFSGMDALEIDAGWNLFCVLEGSGGVSCWGDNAYGQLGQGTTGSFSAPVSVPGLGSVVSLSVGSRHSCVVNDLGEVRCWGWNTSGQVNGTGANVLSPALISGLGPARAVSAGADHTCALLRDGTLRCWGSNSYGQLGDGSRTPHSTPANVPGLTSVEGVSAGDRSTCAWLADGSARCWGNNANGQLGLGGGNRLWPTGGPSLTGFAKVTLGSDFACGMLDTGAVRCWGDGGYGQLGSVESTRFHTPAW
jgi:alpha-tubulin suppressor-like RCC1 family protein